MAMTDEQKRKMAEGRARKAAEKKAAGEKAESAKNGPTVAAPVTGAVYVTPNEKMVRCIYIDSVIPNNEIMIGNGRKISGSGRVFGVPMSEFESTFFTPLISKLIKNRRIIVLDGLTAEQRELYGCDYEENEVIRSEGTFDLFFKMEIPEAAEVFNCLCKEHQELVARRFIDAYTSDNADIKRTISRARVVALNECSKAKNEVGMFTPILVQMNKEEL